MSKANGPKAKPQANGPKVSAAHGLKAKPQASGPKAAGGQIPTFTY